MYPHILYLFRYTHTTVLCFPVFPGVSECTKTVCVGGDVSATLMHGMHIRHMMILMQGQLTFNKGKVSRTSQCAQNLLLHGNYRCRVQFICIPLCLQRLDSLNNDSRLATGAGNRVKKKSIGWSQRPETSIVSTACL